MSTTSTAAVAADDFTTINASLQETLKKVEASLLPSVEEYVSSVSNHNDPSSVGLDFLHVKNTLMLSYLIDWVVYLRDRHDDRYIPRMEPSTLHTEISNTKNNDNNESLNEDSDCDSAKDSLDSNNEEEGTSENDDKNEAGIVDTVNPEQNVIRMTRHRLLEMKTVLEKTRGLDKKLRYQIDKLLAAAIAPSSVFAAGREDDQYASEEESNVVDSNNNNNNNGQQDDPLHFRPDPKSFLDENEDQDIKSLIGSVESNKEENEEDVDVDDDLAAARLAVSNFGQETKSKTRQSQVAAKEDNDPIDGKSNRISVDDIGVYRAPRLTAVPYSLDQQNNRSEKEKSKHRRLRNSELAQNLLDRYGDAPDHEDIHGGASTELYGRQRMASKKLARQEAERTKYEENAMIRLMSSKKEKKEKKHVQRMMEGGSSLAQIANLGNLVRETEMFRQNTKSIAEEEEKAKESAFEEYKKRNQSYSSSTGRPERQMKRKRRNL